MEKLFKSDKKIRLGIWGLGRGASFISSARALNIEVVAGCDIAEDVRRRFHETCPEAFLTANDEEFLAYKDMDAVLIATYFTDHADHAIRALEAGFHVMSEVTSFFTPGQGVRLIEAVQKSGKVYNLLENYPFSKENLYLASLWQEGFFGDFQYGEFEYLHSCRSLAYGYCLPGTPPVVPGYAVHTWRSWLDFHYYNTHSLGPCMKIAGVRPVSVTALKDDVNQPGYIKTSLMGTACPSLVKMDNGGLMRNLMGATSGDYHCGKRIWGTRAAAESLGHGLFIKVGACGNSTWMGVQPQWPMLGDVAEKAGHGGGDFWELYYFAREVLDGVPAPWDIYDACDVTLTGIMAIRSKENGGQAVDIPNFRDPAVREAYRNDEGCQMHFDPLHVFPEGHDPAVSGKYSTLMVALDSDASCLRKAIDGAHLARVVRGDAERVTILRQLDCALKQLPAIKQHYETAQELLHAYPDALACTAIRDMLTLFAPDFTGDEEAARKRLLELRDQVL